MRKYRLIIFSTLFLSPTFFLLGYFFALQKATSDPRIVTVEKTVNVCREPDITAENLWAVVQSWRVDNKLPPYEKNQLLCDIVAQRLPQLEKDYSHDGFIKAITNHTYVWDMPYLGENLANTVYWSPLDTLNAWLASPDHAEKLHRKNTPYSCMGCTTEGVCVQVFGGF